MLPEISVIMPVYNVEKYINCAIESILEQTFENFEFIIIDDGSTDHTYDIVSQYHDKRIIKIRNASNLGVAATLNKAISIARANYLVRMDGDDISKKNRFEKQLHFMNANPNIGISGSHMELINSDGSIIKEQHKKIGYEDIRAGLFFGHTSLAHPSLIMKKDLLDTYHLRYDTAFAYAEDYDFYCRSSQYIILDNYPEALIQYRLHSESVSHKFKNQQILDAQSALYLHLRRLRLPFTLDEFKLHTLFSFPNIHHISFNDDMLHSWLEHLFTWNESRKFLNNELLREYCQNTQIYLTKEAL